MKVASTVLTERLATYPTLKKVKHDDKSNVFTATPILIFKRWLNQ